MSDIVAFLLARLAEDEAVALAATDPRRPGYTWQWVEDATDEPIKAVADDLADPVHEGRAISLRTIEEFPTTSGVGPLPAFVISGVDDALPTGLVHIAHWDPARVLAECAAKRQLIEGTEYRMTFDDRDEHVLFVMAAVYADHADFDPAWMVTR